MRVTNDYDLPEAIVEAVRNDPYDPGKKGQKYISVTSLCNPPQLTKLWRRHEHELVEDASERIWSLLGQSVHSVVERASENSDRYIAETRFYATFGDWTIGGQIDLFDTVSKRLTDFKVTSVWSAKGEIKLSWNRQLNLLAYLLRQNGHQVEEAEIVAILRDWSRTKATYDRSYPDRPVSRIKAMFVDDHRIETWIKQQLADLDSPTPRACTDEERWKRGGDFAVMRGDAIKWAVIKPGRKSAVKIYDSERDAVAHAATQDDLEVERRQPKSAGAKRAVRLFPTLLEAEQYVAAHPAEYLYVEYREAIYQRCEAYCPVRTYCEQARSEGNVFPHKRVI